MKNENEAKDAIQGNAPQSELNIEMLAEETNEEQCDSSSDEQSASSEELCESHTGPQFTLKPEGYDQKFRKELASWFLTFCEDLDDDEKELVKILKAHPFEKSLSGQTLWDVYRNLQEKMVLFKLKIVTNKF